MWLKVKCAGQGGKRLTSKAQIEESLCALEDADKEHKRNQPKGNKSRGCGKGKPKYDECTKSG